MTSLAPFPIPLLALRALLLDTAGCGTKAPDAPWGSVAGFDPFLRLRLYGGSDDGITDTSRIDIDTLTDDELGSLRLAETVRQLLISHPHRVDLGGEDGVVVLDRIKTDTRPHVVPWGESPYVWNATQAIQITARRTH